MTVTTCQIIDTRSDSPKVEESVSWAKAIDIEKNHFKEQLIDKLSRINLPSCVRCHAFSCHEHKSQNEECTLDVLGAVEASSQHSLPSSSSMGKGKTKKSIVPGWSQYVKPYADEDRFWSNVWQSHGKPKFGPAFENMKYARSQYTYAVRSLKRCNDIIKNNKFLAGLVNGDGTGNIFSEIRKLRGVCKTTGTRIDGKVAMDNVGLTP